MSNIKKLVLICLLLIYPLTAFGICQSNADLGYGMQSYCDGAIEALVGTTVYEGNGEYAFDTSSGTIQTAIYKYGCLTKEFVESLGMNLDMDTICPDKNKPYINPYDDEDPKCECVECLENEHCKETSSNPSIERQCNTETYTCCPEDKPLFHDKKCVECYSQENCINRLDGKTQCDMETYTCICPDDKPYFSGDICVECLSNANCSGRTDGKTQCDTETYTCICPDDKPYFSGDICVECLSNANCSDRTDGKTQCDMETYTCICPDDKPYFSGDICVECLNNANCSDRTDGKTECDMETYTCVEPSSCIVGDTCGENGSNYCVYNYPSETACCQYDWSMMGGPSQFSAVNGECCDQFPIREYNADKKFSSFICGENCKNYDVSGFVCCDQGGYKNCCDENGNKIQPEIDGWYSNLPCANDPYETCETAGLFECSEQCSPGEACTTSDGHNGYCASDSTCCPENDFVEKNNTCCEEGKRYQQFYEWGELSSAGCCPANYIPVELLAPLDEYTGTDCCPEGSSISCWTSKAGTVCKQIGCYAADGTYMGTPVSN